MFNAASCIGFTVGGPAGGADVCNDYATSASCCSSGESCYWEPTCSDASKRCTSDVDTDCGGRSSSFYDCLTPGEYFRLWKLISFFFNYYS